MPRDVNELAYLIGRMATGDDAHENGAGPAKNPAAGALGRLGGRKGGLARAKALSAKKRSAIAKRAARARWNKNTRSVK
jgi:hypothetical protein